VIIPYKAVVEQMGEYFVFISKDTTAEQRKIHLGPRLRDQIVVLDGVNAGDKVITEGFQRLRDGGKIDTAAKQQPPAAKK
jgi:membrane fusion protein (multidrug efflux system)